MLERLRREPERLIAWLALAVWVLQPFTLGPLLGEALEPARSLFRRSVSAGLWVSWLVVLLSLALPRSLTLTVARIVGSAALPAAVWAAIETDDTSVILIGLASAVAATTILLSPLLAERFVDGESYGDERRFVLRPPAPVLLGLLVPSWAVVVVGVVAGPLMLADERWVAGVALIILGLPLAYLAGRALHQLTNRFVVFVPNGFVVHDLTVLREPVLFAARDVVGLAPAPADTTAADMTSAALGLALELRLTQPANLPVVTDRTHTEEQDVRALLISPSRPAAVMRAAKERGIRIV